MNILLSIKKNLVFFLWNSRKWQCKSSAIACVKRKRQKHLTREAFGKIRKEFTINKGLKESKTLYANAKRRSRQQIVFVMFNFPNFEFRKRSVLLQKINATEKALGVKIITIQTRCIARVTRKVEKVGYANAAHRSSLLLIEANGRANEQVTHAQRSI